MIYGYARVSTVKQKRDGNSLEDQAAKLKEHGAAEIYVDAFTGTKDNRPEFKKMLSVLESGDTLMVTKLDRFSRSAAQGVTLIDELQAKGVTVHILNMGILDTTPTGKLIRTIILAFAEFERDMIVERTQEGKAIARMRPDFKDGRPRLITAENTINVMCAQQAGEISVNEACKVLNMSKATYYRRLHEQGWTGSNREDYRATV